MYTELYLTSIRWKAGALSLPKGEISGIHFQEGGSSVRWAPVYNRVDKRVVFSHTPKGSSLHPHPSGDM